MSTQIGTYNLETGEILGSLTVNTLQDVQNIKLQSDKRKSNDEFKMFIDEEYGSFYFLFYKMIDKGIKKQYIIRFLYLCTYMDYKNNLLFGNAKGDQRYMLEKDLQEVLKLSPKETKNTEAILIDNGLITINENNNISIVDKYCLKGKIPNNKKKTYKVRIFEDAVQELYEKSQPKEHKKLGLLIEMLPYINLKFNVVCENPNCELIMEIIPINLNKLSELMGYVSDRNSVSKLKRGLFDITVDGEPVIMINQTANGGFVTVNPKVYYKGTKIEDVQYLAKLFQISSKL